jgi:hypothetical protein
MPRLNTSTYLHHDHQLKELWLVDQNVFSYLTPTDQLALHKYFQFASDKTETELIEHHHNVHTGDPSLPHRAGRAYAKLIRGEKAKVGYTVTSSGHRISVRPLMRPETNIELFAKALVMIAERDLKNRLRRERVLNRTAIRAIYPPPADAA